MAIRHKKDYLDKIYEKFPEITPWEIDKIVTHGLKEFYTVNWAGGDVLLQSKYFTLYSGKMFSKGLVFYHYWRIKWKWKLRYQYGIAHRRYDGKYYFSVSEHDYNKYYSSYRLHHKTPRRQKFKFCHIVAYKIKEEALLDKNRDYIFEFDYPEDMGYSYYFKEITLRNVRLIYKRNEANEAIPV